MRPRKLTNSASNRKPRFRAIWNLNMNTGEQAKRLFDSCIVMKSDTLAVSYLTSEHDALNITLARWHDLEQDFLNDARETTDSKIFERIAEHVHIEGIMRVEGRDILRVAAATHGPKDAEKFETELVDFDERFGPHNIVGGTCSMKDGLLKILEVLSTHISDYPHQVAPRYYRTVFEQCERIIRAINSVNVLRRRHFPINRIGMSRDGIFEYRYNVMAEREEFIRELVDFRKELQPFSNQTLFDFDK